MIIKSVGRIIGNMIVNSSEERIKLIRIQTIIRARNIRLIRNVAFIIENENNNRGGLIVNRGHDSYLYKEDTKQGAINIIWIEGFNFFADISRIYHEYMEYIKIK